MVKYSILLVAASCIFSACKSNKDGLAGQQTRHSSEVGVTFLDSTAAAKQIVTDRVDGFFNALSVVELSIQMKSEEKYDSPAAALQSYKHFLQTEVYGFSPEEQTLMLAVMKEAKRIIDKVNPSLWPSNIDLIKTRPNHYGPDVYYTREDAIVIPDNVFAQERTADMLLPVMLHEIYHILSREHKAFRTETYALIDFFPHGKNIVLSPMLAKRRLTNPDGVTLDYAIRLQSDGQSQLSIPFLVSNQPYFSKSIPSFFSYLGFDLYALEKIDNNTLRITADKAGRTTLAAPIQQDYFTHIKDNTQYVIHPEEVMADNFMLGLIAHDTKDYSTFSSSGKELIDQLLHVLKNTEF